uniref:Uncharacterized protein n=1 Tax=viral metagenome TaxID=1070528 RepID=A0A6M3JZE5_9ZZZZ
MSDKVSVRYLGSHNYTGFMPPYARDGEGNIVDADGNALEARYNAENGALYYVIRGTDTPAEAAISGDGYEDYQKLVAKMGGEGGYVQFQRVLMGMSEGIPGAVNEYFNAIEEYQSYADTMGDQYQEIFGPIMDRYNALGQGFAQQTQEFQEDYRNNMNRMESLFTQSGNQQQAINNEYFKQLNMTRNQQIAINQQYGQQLDSQRMLEKSIQPGATKNINIGGLNIGVADDRSRMRKILAQQGITDTLGNAGQFNVGMNQNLGTMLGNAGQFNTNMTNARGDIVSGMGTLGTNAANNIYEGFEGQAGINQAQTLLGAGYFDTLNQAAALQNQLDQQRFNVAGLMPWDAMQAQQLAMLGTAAAGSGGGSSTLGDIGAIAGGAGSLLEGLGAAGVSLPFSDIRLKENIEYL